MDIIINTTLINKAIAPIPVTHVSPVCRVDIEIAAPRPFPQLKISSNMYREFCVQKLPLFSVIVHQIHCAALTGLESPKNMTASPRISAK